MQSSYLIMYTICCHVANPPGEMNLVDCFYQRFLVFADSDMLVGFKLGMQFFDDPGVEPVAGGCSP